MHGFVVPATTVLATFRALEGQYEDVLPFQCTCGAIAVVGRDAYSQSSVVFSDSDGNALCGECGKYAYNMSREISNPRISEGLKELRNLLYKAKTENAATLCYFLYASLIFEINQINQIRHSVTLIQDITAKHALEKKLTSLAMSPVVVTSEYVHETDVLLGLLTYNHIYELSSYYDVLLNLMLIADNRQRLIGEDGRTINPVGEMIRREAQPDEVPGISYKVAELKKYCHDNGHDKIGQFLTFTYDNKLRNAIAHSNYIVQPKGVYLPQDQRSYPGLIITSMVEGITFAAELVLGFIERERDDFMNSEGVIEGGYRISPIVDGHRFSVQISSPP